MDTNNPLELQDPDYTISLATSGLIVSVEVNVWSATKQDNQISEEVTSAYKADKEAARVVKHLLAGDPTHKSLLKHRQTVYNWVKKRTYDWSGTNRYLPFVEIEKFKTEFRQMESDFKDLVEKFVSRYPDIVSAMAFKQGEMFDATEYPSVEELRNRFRMRLFISDVPAGDFRCAIAKDIAEDLKQHYKEQANDRVQEIMRDAAQRLVVFIKRIANVCREAECDDEGKQKKKPKIYEGTIEGAKELCASLASFNLTSDKELEEMRVALSNILNDVTAKDLRESDATRAHVKNEVDSIINKFSL